MFVFTPLLSFSSSCTLCICICIYGVLKYRYLMLCQKCGLLLSWNGLILVEWSACVPRWIDCVGSEMITMQWCSTNTDSAYAAALACVLFVFAYVCACEYVIQTQTFTWNRPASNAVLHFDVYWRLHSSSDNDDTAYENQ